MRTARRERATDKQLIRIIIIIIIVIIIFIIIFIIIIIIIVIIIITTITITTNTIMNHGIIAGLATMAPARNRRCGGLN